MTAPPVTSRITPVIQLASSDARNRAACATSSGVPRRRIGWTSISCCCIGSEIHCLFFAVRIVSGAMAFTWMPNGPTWVAKCCVSIWMPAFAAAYGTGDRGFGLRAAEDDIVRIVPAFRAFIPGRTLLIVRNVAVRLPSTEARQPSSVMSSRGPGGVKLPPAFATRMSNRPEVPLDLLAYRLDLGELGQVTRNGDRSTTFLLDLRVHRGQGLRIPTVDRDECALPREETGDCRPNTSGAARHPGDLATQTFHDDAPAGPARALPATTRPHTSSRTMIAWMTRSGTVLGPMPIAIVNRPTNVPINAKPWTANAIPRTARGRIQVASRPPSRMDAITLSAAAAAPCANPGRKTPKWNAAADRNVADSTSRNVRIDPAEGISAADGPRCAVDVAITEPPESDCTVLPRGASFRASGRKCRSRGARLPRPAVPCTSTCSPRSRGGLPSPCIFGGPDPAAPCSDT